jgi:hypothetical protein
MEVACTLAKASGLVGPLPLMMPAQALPVSWRAELAALAAYIGHGIQLHVTRCAPKSGVLCLAMSSFYKCQNRQNQHTHTCAALGAYTSRMLIRSLLKAAPPCLSFKFRNTSRPQK